MSGHLRYEHPNPEVAEVCTHLRCGTCGAPRAHGLMVTVEKKAPRLYVLKTRCLRCSAWVHAELTVNALEPGEVDPAAGRDRDPISSDELLDLKSMPEATFADEWAKLTGAK